MKHGARYGCPLGSLRLQSLRTYWDRPGTRPHPLFPASENRSCSIPGVAKSDHGRPCSMPAARRRTHDHEIGCRPASERAPASRLPFCRAVLRSLPGDLVVSKQKLRRADAIACVRLKSHEANQNPGFASRPFVLSGLPVQKPVADQLLHERRNGQFSLQVTGHPSYGLPRGHDRLIPIFLATLTIRQQSQTIRFRSAAEVLESFGMQQGRTHNTGARSAVDTPNGTPHEFRFDESQGVPTASKTARFPLILPQMIPAIVA